MKPALKIFDFKVSTPVSRKDKKKTKLNILFSHFFGLPQKEYMKAFIKPFEAPQKSVKRRI